MAEPKRRGRPPKKPEDRADQSVTTFLTAADLRAVKVMADIDRVSVSRWIAGQVKRSLEQPKGDAPRRRNDGPANARNGKQEGRKTAKPTHLPVQIAPDGIPEPEHKGPRDGRQKGRQTAVPKDLKGVRNLARDFAASPMLPDVANEFWEAFLKWSKGTTGADDPDDYLDAAFEKVFLANPTGMKNGNKEDVSKGWRK